MKKLAVIVIAIVLSFSAISIFLSINEEPEKAFYRIQGYAQNRDWNSLHRNLSEKTQSEVILLAAMSRQYTAILEIPEEGGSSDAEIFANAMTGSPALHSLFFVGEFATINTEINEDRATIQLLNLTDNSARTAELVKESILWKLDIRIE